MEQQYLAQDPWFGAARNVAQTQYAPPRNDAEAFLLPFLQNSISGVMAGYGRENARNTAYQDISKMLGGTSYKPSSLVKQLGPDGIETEVPLQYGLEEAPEGFSIKTGLQDLLLANSAQQAQIEAAAKAQELKDKLAIESSQPYLESIRQQELAKAEGKAQGERVQGGLTTDQQLKLETDITNKLSTGSEAQKVLETQSKAKQVLEALKKDDPIRAATAIYGFAKLLDPDGVVRKEDGTIVANPGGPAGALASYYNTLLQKGQLTEQTKKSMKEIIPSLVKTQYESYEALKNTLIGSAVKQGARKEMIGALPPMDMPVNVPPGYKLQRNKTTGETRIVKQ